jgi:integrase
MAYRRLAEFMKRQGAIDAEAFEGFRLEMLELSRGYEPKPVNLEDLLTEAQILEIWRGIKQPGWKWVYGMLATYGLRPHEIFNLDLERFTCQTKAIRVFDTTKTGQRLAYPCPSAWRERFELWDVQLPDIQTEGKSNKDLGRKVSQEFREQKIWHDPYDLRHA